jgi:pilus assembly protein CpaB
MRNRVSGGRGGKAVLLLALFLGLISAVLVYVFLSQTGGEETVASDTGATKSVVVATADISPGTRISEDMVKMKAVPEEAVVAGGFFTTADVVGSIARFPIAAEEQVLGDRLISTVLTTDSEGLPLSYVVPEGKRGLSIRVEQVISAGGLVLPGDRVDVIMVANIKSNLPPPLDESHLSFTILQNVEVLAVDQAVEEVVPETTGDGTTSTETDSGATQRVPLDRPDANPEATTVTVAVTPGEAQILAMADEKATLRLALRPFGDEQPVSVEPMSDFELVSVPVLESLIRTWKALAGPLKEAEDLFKE